MNLPFQLPPLSQNGSHPIWTGQDFQLDDKRVKVLHYSSNNTGWNDEINSFHEDALENHFLNKVSRDFN
jgi:hypothetical protein